MFAARGFFLLALVATAAFVSQSGGGLTFPGTPETASAATTSPDTTLAPQSSIVSSVAPSIPWTVRGFNYPSWQRDDYQSEASGESLTRMASTGANWVAIVPTKYMSSATGSEIGVPDNRAATDEAVARAIDDAHARGLKVLLKPHIDVIDGTSRVDIQPADAASWFANYDQVINQYAALAQAHNVEMLAVGTELASIDRANNYGYWAGIIANVRARYQGPLTYAASLNDFDSVSFAGLLDYLGLDMYFPLSDLAEPSVEDLMLGWTDYHGYYGEANWMSRIENWQAHWNKPVILTELGYRSIKYVGLTPWDCSPGEYDGYNQSRAFEAAFRVLSDKQWLAGAFFWDWAVDNAVGGPGDTGYTVRDKPAESVVTSWFTGGTAAEPSVEVHMHGATWASYADYLSGKLTVDYGLSNVGGGQALQSSISASLASAGVQVLTPLPLDVGPIETGAERSAAITYRIPPGVFSFRVTNFVASLDATGSWHVDPRVQ